VRAGATLEALSGPLSQLEASLAGLQALEASLTEIAGNPDWKQMLAGGAETAGNAAEITRTMDIATRALREAQGRVKAVLKWLLGMLKIDPLR